MKVNLSADCANMFHSVNVLSSDLNSVCINKTKFMFSFFNFIIKVEVRKQTCWLEAVEVIRAAGGPQIRKWDAIRKKWNELKVQAHKYQLKKSVTGKPKP